ncbi:adhesion G protein-coupled receptor B1-like [Haliotis rufescens]|uniref:adhesion G protein-coupled receptor B1-like n=1 Tax=Haliotis rufescens TaxID=6454 RepID=UPI00201F5F0D|nr:adhesion G protein-coupled receptor B1-like [Haliotis rufescens]XP_048258370.1 adhesion G protein-coupled receptor B1-like [Haliotis rufescens]
MFVACIATSPVLLLLSSIVGLIDSYTIVFNPSSPVFTNGTNNAVLECSILPMASGMSLRLFHEARELGSETGKRLTSSGSSTTITIDTITLADKGNYTCKAYNGSTEVASRSTDLKVYEIPRLAVFPPTLEIAGKQTSTLRCSVNNPAHISPAQDTSIIWCKDGMNITSAVGSVKLVGKESHLTITSVEVGSTYGCGIRGYLCSAHTITRPLTTTSTTHVPTANVSISGGVTSDYTFRDKDSNASVSCDLTSSPPTDLTIQWFRNGFRLQNTALRVHMSQHELAHGHFVGTLHFSIIYRRDADLYSCKTSKSAREWTSTIHVYSHPILQLISDPPFVDDGSNATLTCNLSNKDSSEPGAFANITWFENGKPLQETGRNITKTGLGSEKLYIDKVSEDTVFCCCLNITCSRKAKLTILKKDSAVCKPEPDSKGRNWTKAKAGGTMVNVCPVAYDGTISRRCNEREQWEDPKDFSCVNQTLLGLIDKLENIEERLEPKDNIRNLLLNFRNITSNKELPLTAGDLNTSITLLEDIATFFNSSEYILKDVTKIFLDIVDEILSLEKKKDWDLVTEMTEVPRASSLLDILKLLGEASGHHQTDQVIDVTGRNLIFQVTNTTKPVDIIFPSKYNANGTATLKLNQITLQNIATEPRGHFIIVLVYFSTLSQFISTAHTSASRADCVNRATFDFIEDSAIVSLHIYRNNPGERRTYILDLNPGIEVHNPHNTVPVDKQLCVEMDHTEMGWSTCSATKKSGNETITFCTYQQTGNYGVAENTVKIPEIMILAIKIVAGILLLAVVVMAIMNFLAEQNRTEHLIALSMHSSVAISYGLLVFGGTSSENKDICSNIAICINFFFLTTSFLTLSLSLSTVEQAKRFAIGMLIASLALPLIIIIIYLSVKGKSGYGSNDVCVPSTTNNALYLLIIPLLAVAVVQVILCIIVGITGKEGKRCKCVNKYRSVYCRSVFRSLRLGTETGIGILLSLLTVYSQETIDVLFSIVGVVQTSLYVLAELELPRENAVWPSPSLQSKIDAKYPPENATGNILATLSPEEAKQTAPKKHRQSASNQ